MKKAFKSLVVSVLAQQVKRLRQKHNFKIVAVVGSIGKTSTKFSIAHILSGGLRVQYQKGNYNDLVSVPLIFFGHDIPSLMNPFAWAGIFMKNRRIIKGDYPYDVVVIELGTDGPGQVAAFKKYLDVDIAVVTALTPEHMEYFSSLDAVVAEELSVASYSHTVLVNTDLSPQNVRAKGYKTYAIEDKSADYSLKDVKRSANGYEAVYQGEKNSMAVSMPAISKTQLYSLLAACSVAEMLNVDKGTVVKQAASLVSMPGRMNLLNGKRGSKIIDDSYNSSPEAVKLALQTLYDTPAKKRIAVLGNMNELGETSEESHKMIGRLCDSSKLSLVLTLGPHANEFTAPEAEKTGCEVKTFEDPVSLGEYVEPLLDKDTVVLVKGSQNRVYSEESIKPMLDKESDKSKLVRQSPSWIKTKRKQFPRVGE